MPLRCLRCDDCLARLSLRMYVDHPKSGDGPTDVRVSLLVTADLGLLFGS